MKCPCKGCPNAGCGSYHDKCETYQEWKNGLDEAHKTREKEITSRTISRDHEMKYRKNLKAGRLKK